MNTRSFRVPNIALAGGGLLCLLALLAGCVALPTSTPALPSTPTSTPAAPLVAAAELPVATATPVANPTVAPTVVVPTPVEERAYRCATVFERRELRAPYQKSGGRPRYTLSSDELKAILAEMGIEGLCIPTEFGAPFLNVDWNRAASTAITGRMISLGFEDLYSGAGWSNGYVVYATYDFATGSEYDTFATTEDRDALRRDAMPGAIEVNGLRGFIRYRPSLCYGSCTLFKTTVFPLDKSYIAVVAPLAALDADTDWTALAQRLQTEAYPAERYPAENRATAQALDWLAKTIRFRGHIAWSDAEPMILTGKAQKIAQSHAREVTLTLADGVVLETVEPALDDVIRLIQRCGVQCARVALVTE